MVFSPEDSYLGSLYNELVQFFQGSNKPRARYHSSTPRAIRPGTYQAPIKGAFYNSGNFSPTQATDPRHPKGHQGVDLRAPGGTAVYPIAPGVVTFVGTDPSGGNVVNVQHAGGVRSYYAHLGTIRVQKGDRVDNNSVLASVGNSGNAKTTWPHVHLQVWKDNQIQNPGNYFNVPPYTNVDNSKEKQWISERAKQLAQSFNVRQHVAMAGKYDELVKIAAYYEEICLK